MVPTEHNGLTHVYFQQRRQLDRRLQRDRSTSRSPPTAGAAGWPAAPWPAPPSWRTARRRSITDVHGRPGRPPRRSGCARPESFASNDDASGPTRARDLRRRRHLGGPDPGPTSSTSRPSRATCGWPGSSVINQLDGEHWWQIRMDARVGDELAQDDWVDADSHNVYPPPDRGPQLREPRPGVEPGAPAPRRSAGTTPTARPAPSRRSPSATTSAPTPTPTTTTCPTPAAQPDGGAGLAFNFPLDLTQAPVDLPAGRGLEPLLHQQPHPRHPLPLRLQRGRRQLPGQQLRQRRRRQRRGERRGAGRRRAPTTRTSPRPPDGSSAADADVRLDATAPGPRRRPRQRRHHPRVRPRRLEPPHRRPGQRRLPGATRSRAARAGATSTRYMLTHAQRRPSRPAAAGSAPTPSASRPPAPGIRTQRYSTDIGDQQRHLRLASRPLAVTARRGSRSGPRCCGR